MQVFKRLISRLLLKHAVLSRIIAKAINDFQTSFRAIVQTPVLLKMVGGGLHGFKSRRCFLCRISYDYHGYSKRSLKFLILFHVHLNKPIGHSLPLFKKRYNENWGAQEESQKRRSIFLLGQYAVEPSVYYICHDLNGTVMQI